MKPLKQPNPPAHHFINYLGWFLLISLILVFSLSFLSFLFWPLELLTHFYLQYALGFAGLVGLWVLLRRSVVAVVSLFGFLLSFVWLVPFYYQPRAVAKPSLEQTRPLTVVFNNINYHTNNFNRLLDYVNQVDPEVIALVEVPYHSYLSLKAELTNYPYSYHQPGLDNRHGLVVFSKRSFSRKPYTHYFGRSSYPALEVGLGPKNHPFLTLVVIHPPPPLTKRYQAERDEVFRGLADYLAKKQVHTIVVGDFNSTSFSPSFKSLVRKSNTVDTRMGRGTQPSWPTQLPALMRLAIDHALVTKDLTVVDRSLGPNLGSDHLPFSLRVLVPQDHQPPSTKDSRQ